MKTTPRARRKKRIRRKIEGTEQKPRLTVFKSLRSIYAQLIDDLNGRTICAAMIKGKKNVGAAKELGQIIAAKAKEKSISQIVFDRNGYPYLGAIKEFANSVRANELKF